MEIRRWQCYIIINCALIHYLEAKTFSLNELIEAESKQNHHLDTPPIIKEHTVRRFTSRKHLTPGTLKLQKNRKQGNKIREGQKVSPLKYRKTFQINSPLKPRKLKIPINLRHKRKNQSVKREINGNDKLKQKYIPLLRSLSMLFDNLLNSDTSESYEYKSTKYKRNRFYFDSQEKSEDDCPCPNKFTYGNTGSRSEQKTTTAAAPQSAKIPINSQNFTATKTTTAQTNPTSSTNISRIRPNKNVSILFPRNTFSARRNNNGVSERSGTAHNRNTEGHIAGHHGNREHNARVGDEPITESNEKNTGSTSRVSASGDEIRRGILGDGGVSSNSKNRSTADETVVSENERTIDNFGEIKFEARRNKTQSAKPISESIRRLRGFVSEDKDGDTPESVQSEEVREESNVDVTFHIADDKRIIGRGGSPATEDQKIRARDEAVTPFEVNPISNINQSTNKSSGPLLMIFDGYSVTRDKNGENKLAEKSIRIHS